MFAKCRHEHLPVVVMRMDGTSSGTRKYLMVFPRMYVSGMRQKRSPSCTDQSCWGRLHWQDSHSLST